MLAYQLWFIESLTLQYHGTLSCQTILKMLIS